MTASVLKKLDPHALGDIIDNFIRAYRRKDNALLKDYSLEDLKLAYATRPQYERNNGHLVLMKQKIDELEGDEGYTLADGEPIAETHGTVDAQEAGSPFGIVQMQKRKPGRPSKKL